MLDVTRKFHVLAVFEDGSFRSVRETKVLLDKHFGLKPSLDAVRKHLERCRDQGLLTDEKIGGSRFYRITGKGKERLKRIRARKTLKLRERLARPEPTVAPEIVGEENMSDRALFEVAPAIRLCDIVLNLSEDPEILNWVRPVREYWLLEFAKLTPRLPLNTTIALYSTIFNRTVPIKRQDTLFTFAFWKQRNEEEFLSYFLMQQEEKEHYERLYREEQLKRKELERKLELKKLEEQLWTVKKDFELGRQIGKLEVLTNQCRSQGKLISSILQKRLAREPKERERLKAILLRRRIDWRWDLLKLESDISLPCVPSDRPARAPGMISKSIEKEHPYQNEHEYDLDSWWQHLTREDDRWRKNMEGIPETSLPFTIC